MTAKSSVTSLGLYGRCGILWTIRPVSSGSQASCLDQVQCSMASRCFTLGVNEARRTSDTFQIQHFRSMITRQAVPFQRIRFWCQRGVLEDGFLCSNQPNQGLHQVRGGTNQEHQALCANLGSSNPPGPWLQIHHHVM